MEVVGLADCTCPHRQGKRPGCSAAFDGPGSPPCWGPNASFARPPALRIYASARGLVDDGIHAARSTFVAYACICHSAACSAMAGAGGIHSDRASLPWSPLHERLGLHSPPSVLPPISELRVSECRPVRRIPGGAASDAPAMKALSSCKRPHLFGSSHNAPHCCRQSGTRLGSLDGIASWHEIPESHKQDEGGNRSSDAERELVSCKRHHRQHIER